MTHRLGGRPSSGRRRGASAVALNLPPTVRLRVSPAGFRRLCGANPDLRLERTAEGVLVAMSPAGSDSGRRNALLTARLVNWAVADGTGVPFDSSAGFTLPNTAVRAPDVSWVTRERWDALTPAEKRTFSAIYPDFAAELRSPSDTRAEVQAKMREYLAQGTRLGWLIDPEAEEVEVYRPGRPVEVLKRPDSLPGEDVLPGFVLDLKGILFD